MESWHCDNCGKDVQIRKERFKSQTISGHKKNCSKTPGARWYKPPTTEGDTPTAPDPAPPTTQPPKEEVSGSGITHVDTSAIVEFSKPPEPENQEPGADNIPSNVVKEWIMLGLSVNYDLANSYAKSKNLPPPNKMEMSTETAKWIASLISKEVGPVQSSWVIIIAALGPYLAGPWLPLIAPGKEAPHGTPPG